MEIESLFSSTRWEILRMLSAEKLSPMELAKKMHTTSANISQQLRLLELANLVQSERIANVDKGKPRVVYSLKGNKSFLILSMPHCTQKKLLTLSLFHKFILKALFVENAYVQEHIVQLYFVIKPFLKQIEAVSVHSFTGEVSIVTNDKTVQKQIKKMIGDLKLVFVNQVESSSEHITLYNQNENNEVM